MPDARIPSSRGVGACFTVPSVESSSVRRRRDESGVLQRVRDGRHRLKWLMADEDEGDEDDEDEGDESEGDESEGDARGDEGKGEEEECEEGKEEECEKGDEDEGEYSYTVDG